MADPVPAPRSCAPPPHRSPPAKALDRPALHFGKRLPGEVQRIRQLLAAQRGLGPYRLWIEKARPVDMEVRAVAYFLQPGREQAQVFQAIPLALRTGIDGPRITAVQLPQRGRATTELEDPERMRDPGMEERMAGNMDECLRTPPVSTEPTQGGTQQQRLLQFGQIPCQRPLIARRQQLTQAGRDRWRQPRRWPRQWPMHQPEYRPLSPAGNAAPRPGCARNGSRPD